MTENNEGTQEVPTTFSADYVQQLRNENASWRLKVRELEQANSQVSLKAELGKYGLDIDPAFINIPEGMSVTDAVAQLAKKFTPSPQLTEQSKPQYPAPLQSNPSNVNNPGPSGHGPFGTGRTLEEIKKDPKARKQLQDWYREQLQGATYGNTDTIF